MATKKIKVNFKMPTPTAAERLHAQHQKVRKAAGLPDPSEYKKKLDSMKTEQLEKKGRFVSGPIKQPFKSNTIVTSVKEAKDGEYDYEGAMAKSQLRSLIYNCEQLNDMLKDDMNLPEWCQSKITLAEDYITTVANYMRSEMSEAANPAQQAAIAISMKEKGIKPKSMKEEAEQLEENSQDDHFAKQSQKMRDAINTHLRRGHTYENAVKLAKRHVKEEVEQIDEKKNLPGLWANIRAKKARGESPAKPGDKDYPEDLETVRAAGKKSVKESAQDPTEGEMKDKQGYSRKAQIVMTAAKGKKSDNPDKFQKDPELSSEIHKT